MFKTFQKCTVFKIIWISIFSFRQCCFFLFRKECIQFTFSTISFFSLLFERFYNRFFIGHLNCRGKERIVIKSDGFDFFRNVRAPSFLTQRIAHIEFSIFIKNNKIRVNFFKFRIPFFYWVRFIIFAEVYGIREEFKGLFVKLLFFRIKTVKSHNVVSFIKVNLH